MVSLSWLSDSIREFFRKGDILLLSLCLAASGFGLVLIYSATRYLDSNRAIIIQSIAIVLGVLVYILISSVDLELLVDHAWKFLLGFNILFLLSTRIPGLGVAHGGNRSWIRFPGLPVDIQPAEIVKLTFVLLLAAQCARIQAKGRNISSPASVARLSGHLLLMCGIIAVASGDFGMLLTYSLIFIFMLWVAGVQKRWFLLGFGVVDGGAGLCAFLFTHSQKFHDRFSYILLRFTVVIDHLMGNTETLREQTLGKGMQQSRSILAIGSGQLTGQGYLQGVQTQSSLNWALNARSTDEIFAVCGEEFGLLGCLLLLALLGAIILRCIWVARRACSPQSAYIAMGFAGMLLSQVAINVSMCLYIFPVVGLTLPFVSYGGSSIVTMFAAMGIVSSIKMRSLPSWLRGRSTF